jgi:fructoselysine-6-P-deglycase FrlB-like protein
MTMTSTSPSALDAIHDEMERQAYDARQSFANNEEAAGRLAASLRRTGRLVLLGMGGSHAVNRVAEPLYRQAGIDATALPLSEMLRSPIPLMGGTAVVTSQSGESGEVLAYLQHPAGGIGRFGLTLAPDSALARAVPCLIGHGGMERAFAATRSLFVSLALHARVLHELELSQGDAFGDLAQLDHAAIEAAAERLSAAHAVIFSGRGPMHGVAEAAALGLLELARMPAFALEGGQLRHGPLEALGPETGVVFIREAGPPDSTDDLARICIGAGSPTLIVDASGLSPSAGTAGIALQPASGMQAAFAILPAVQALMIAVARRRVVDVGAPLRSTKVTRET